MTGYVHLKQPESLLQLANQIGVPSGKTRIRADGEIEAQNGDDAQQAVPQRPAPRVADGVVVAHVGQPPERGRGNHPKAERRDVVRLLDVLVHIDVELQRDVARRQQ